MHKLIGSCAGIIVFAIIAAACGHRETTTIHRESVQTAPAAPAVVEKKTTTTETRY
jgi:hypothetical protein